MWLHNNPTGVLKIFVFLLLKIIFITQIGFTIPTTLHVNFLYPKQCCRSFSESLFRIQSSNSAIFNRPFDKGFLDRFCSILGGGVQNSWMACLLIRHFWRSTNARFTGNKCYCRASQLVGLKIEQYLWGRSIDTILHLSV